MTDTIFKSAQQASVACKMDPAAYHRLLYYPHDVRLSTIQKIEDNTGIPLEWFVTHRFQDEQIILSDHLSTPFWLLWKYHSHRRLPDIEFISHHAAADRFVEELAPIQSGSIHSWTDPTITMFGNIIDLVCSSPPPKDFFAFRSHMECITEVVSLIAYNLRASLGVTS